METREALLLLQILYAQRPNWDFKALLTTFNGHPLVPEPIEDPIEVAVQRALIDAPRRVSPAYFNTNEGLLKLETSCETLYEQRIAEIKNQIKDNQDRVYKQDI